MRLTDLLVDARQARGSVRFTVALTARENEPTTYGVYDTYDRRAGFNGKLVDEFSTQKAAQACADRLNGVRS